MSLLYLVITQCLLLVSARSTSQTIKNDTVTDISVVYTPQTTLRPIVSENSREGRGMLDLMDYEDHDDLFPEDDHHPPTTTAAAAVLVQQESKAVKDDNWEGYYDFLINEGSYKFWAAFQLATACLLIYSAFAAVYYAKFNPISSDYDYYDDFFRRRSLDATSGSWFGGMDAHTFQRIIDAITSKKYA